jgi:hypothetical protein
MGCDGGTIPTRDELVRLKKKKVKQAKEVTNSAKWNYCNLSQQALQKPVVGDLMGKLYNKDCLIEFLLERSKYESGPAYVKSLKDVKELNLTDNPSHSVGKEDAYDATNINKFSSPFICPISGLEMNGTYKFCYLFTCGCAFAEKILKSVKTNGTETSQLKCMKCDQIYSSLDLIVLNPDDDDAKINESKMIKRAEIAAKAVIIKQLLIKKT